MSMSEQTSKLEGHVCKSHSSLKNILIPCSNSTFTQLQISAPVQNNFRALLDYKNILISSFLELLSRLLSAFHQNYWSIFCPNFLSYMVKACVDYVSSITNSIKAQKRII